MVWSFPVCCKRFRSIFSSNCVPRICCGTLRGYEQKFVASSPLSFAKLLGGSFPFFNNFSSFISSNYGVFAEDGGSILLEWHYDSEPVYFRGYSISYLSSAFSPPHSLQDIYYWHGPWTSLIIGNYSL